MECDLVAKYALSSVMTDTICKAIKKKKKQQLTSLCCYIFIKFWALKILGQTPRSFLEGESDMWCQLCSIRFPKQHTMKYNFAHVMTREYFCNFYLLLNTLKTLFYIKTNTLYSKKCFLILCK